MGAMTVKRRDKSVVLVNHDTNEGMQIHSWEIAEEIAQRIRAHARKLVTHRETVSMGIVIRTEGDDVIVEAENRLFAIIPCAVALEISNAMLGHIRMIEEEVKAVDITFDEALLLRAGIPLGVTNNADIQEEARREAQFNALLRKAFHSGVKAREHIGVPEVINHG